MARPKKRRKASPRAQVRKPIPPPARIHADELEYRRSREKQRLRREPPNGNGASS